MRFSPEWEDDVIYSDRGVAEVIVATDHEGLKLGSRRRWSLTDLEKGS